MGLALAALQPDPQHITKSLPSVHPAQSCTLSCQPVPSMLTTTVPTRASATRTSSNSLPGHPQVMYRNPEEEMRYLLYRFTEFGRHLTMH